MFNVDKISLSIYIAHQHKLKTGKDIGRIRLQKTLYFLFAYWSKKYDGDFYLDLFDPDFRAWSYGPADEEIFKLQKSGFYEDIESKTEEADYFELNTETIVMYFINSFLLQSMSINEFSLVGISQSDKCWKDAYDKGVSYSDKPISSDSIKLTYVKIGS